MGENLTPLQNNIRNIFADLGVDRAFMDASDHSYKCKCSLCLQWWVTVGPEDAGDGWTFGPFTEEEFVSGGGVVPPYESEATG